MATGAFSSCSILSGGAQAKLIFGTPGTWTAAFTIATNPDLWPVFTVGAGGNANIIHTSGVAVAAAVNGSNLEITVDLTGYVYTGETVTVTTVSAYITDSIANVSGATSASATTNSSAATQGTAYTRFKGAPVVAWAIQDKYPFTGSTARVALDAVDDWAGVDYVELTFSGAVTLITDASVSDQGSIKYRITSKRWVDLRGYGDYADYWYLDIDISGASDGDYRTVSAVNVRTKDGADTDAVGGGHVTTRVITKRATPTIKYLDSLAAGAGTGADWTNAYTTIAAAITGASTTADIVYVAPGTYTAASPSFDQSRVAGGKFVVWQYNAGSPQGAGTVNFNLSGTANWKRFNAFKTITINAATNTQLRTASTDHVFWENCTFVHTDKVQTSTMPVTSCAHCSFFHCTQTDGYRGPSFSLSAGVNTTDMLISGYVITASGTAVNGQLIRGMVERITASGCAGSGYAADTHFDAVHWFGTISISGCDWTEATKTLSKTGAFTNIALSARDIVVVSGNGTYADAEAPLTNHTVASRTSNDAIVLLTSLAGDGLDKTGAQISVSYQSPAFKSGIVRYNKLYDNGLKIDATALVWTDAGRTLTATGAWTTYTHFATAIFVCTGGSAVTLGSYSIASKTNNDTIVLSGDINGTNSNATAVTGFIVTRNYNMTLLESHGNDIAYYNNEGYSLQSTQQVAQVHGDQRNVQITRNTWLAFDNDGQLNTRGLFLSGAKTGDPIDVEGFLFRNNIINTMGSSNGGSAVTGTGQRSGLIWSEHARKFLIGPNLITLQSALTPSAMFADSSLRTSAGTNASIGLTDIAASPYNFLPGAGTAATPTLFTDAHDHVKFDYGGNARSTIHSSAGALAAAIEYSTPSAPVITSATAVSSSQVDLVLVQYGGAPSAQFSIGIQSSPDGVTYTFAIGANYDATTASVTVLTSGTWYFRSYVANESGPNSDYSNVVTAVVSASTGATTRFLRRGRPGVSRVLGRV